MFQPSALGMGMVLAHGRALRQSSGRWAGRWGGSDQTDFKESPKGSYRGRMRGLGVAGF